MLRVCSCKPTELEAAVMVKCPSYVAIFKQCVDNDCTGSWSMHHAGPSMCIVTVLTGTPGSAGVQDFKCFHRTHDTK